MALKKDTRLVSVGRDPEGNHGIVNPPVYHASTVTFSTVAELQEKEKNRFDDIFYGLYGTPTTRAFEDAVADLEGGYRSIAMPSGLAAIAGTLLALLKSGDHVLMTDSVYSPTRIFCEQTLKGLNIETTYYDPRIGSGIADLIRPETKVIFTESPGSITFEVQDIPAISKEAHNRNCVVVIDNTWSAGYYLQPFALGADISIQAATKYLVGHSDAMLGTITTTKNLFFQIKKQISLLGYAAAPDDCYLGLRGMRSLAVRLARHQESAMELAYWLEQRTEVDLVLYPGLPWAPDYELWKRDFSGSSGLFSIVLKEGYSIAAVNAMLDGMELFSMGYSWGGYESLIVYSDLTNIRTAFPWPHKGACLRLHVGLADLNDLRKDLEAGFTRLETVR